MNKISYTGFNGQKLTAEYKTESGISFMDIRDELTGKQLANPFMVEHEAETFFNNITKEQ